MVTKPAFNESLEKSRMAYVTWSVPYPTNGILKNYRLTIYHNKIRTPIINIPGKMYYSTVFTWYSATFWKKIKQD